MSKGVNLTDICKAYWKGTKNAKQTWTRPCEIAVFSNHLQDWNLWFFRVTFLGWVLNFVGESLWDLPLCLKLGSQIVPQPGPTKVEKTAGPPHEGSAVFLVASQISRAADFKNHFPNSVLRCHSPYSKWKGLPIKCKTEKFFETKTLFKIWN